MSFLGAALLLAAAVPAAHFLVASPARSPQLAAGLALFAPGLAGYGLVAGLSRVLLAAQRTRAAAIRVAAAGWWSSPPTSCWSRWRPARWVVAMLALGNTIGLTAGRAGAADSGPARRGPAALAGAGRAAVSGLAAATAGGRRGRCGRRRVAGSGPGCRRADRGAGAAVALAAFAGVALRPGRRRTAGRRGQGLAGRSVMTEPAAPGAGGTGQAGTGQAGARSSVAAGRVGG